jgi:hypothetical protein
MAKTTHIIDWTSGSGTDSIQIEAYPMAAHIGINPYARLIIYPASANPIVKTDVGTATQISTVSNLIFREKISFSGKTANARFRINALAGNVQGFFFNANNNETNPSFSVKNGVLEASQEVWGSCYINYYSTGVVYEYDAEVVGFTTTIGTVFAFHPEKKGIAASYEIPAHTKGGDREDVIIIYREVIVQGANQFEMPDGTPAWPDDAVYLSYPSAQTDDKPIAGDAYAVQQENRHIVFVENSAFFDDTSSPFWNKPETVGTFQGVKWKIKSNIPTEPTETIDAGLITQLNDRLLELQNEYGIV